MQNLSKYSWLFSAIVLIAGFLFLHFGIVDYGLTGREWFHFVDATYTFERVEGQTKITRTSSYKSVLYPRL
jgi:hypothetical protein